MPADEVPIVYVPGYDRGDLRAIEECPPELQPIAELQYRGVFFGSRAGRDWTTTAFFSNREEGLGIEIGRDADTEAAFARALAPPARRAGLHRCGRRLLCAPPTSGRCSILTR